MNSLMNQSFYNLLFKNPKYLVHCSYQNYDNEIRLYPEQQELIEDITSHVLMDKPRLMASALPTGQGKSFASAVLAKRLSVDAPNKTLLFACSNELVNNQLSADVLGCGDGTHLWLAKHNFIVNKEGKRVQKFLLRPHKSAFKINWKRAYKENNDMKFDSLPKQWMYYSKLTQRTPDIIVSDLECCLELLKHQEDLDNPFVLFLDEFVTTEGDGEIVAQIVKTGLPKQTIFSSSVLPKFENIPLITNSFCRQYNTEKETCCIRQSSYNIKIPCCVVDKNGIIGFPHHMIQSKQELEVLIENMKVNARIRRSYASKYVYHWVTTSLKHILPENLQFHVQFPNIGTIEQNQVNEYVILILEFLKENFDYLSIFQEYRPKAFEECNDGDKDNQNKSSYVRENNLFDKDTYLFDVKGKH